MGAKVFLIEDEPNITEAIGFILSRDGLTIREDVKYIYVGRDLRDVFMSLWNHYRGYTEDAYALFNNPEGLVGDPIPRCPIPGPLRSSAQRYPGLPTP